MAKRIATSMVLLMFVLGFSSACVIKHKPHVPPGQIKKHSAPGQRKK